MNYTDGKDNISQSMKEMFFWVGGTISGIGIIPVALGILEDEEGDSTETAVTILNGFLIQLMIRMYYAYTTQPRVPLYNVITSVFMSSQCSVSV